MIHPWIKPIGNPQRNEGDKANPALVQNKKEPNCSFKWETTSQGGGGREAGRGMGRNPGWGVDPGMQGEGISANNRGACEGDYQGDTHGCAF